MVWRKVGDEGWAEQRQPGIMIHDYKHDDDGDGGDDYDDNDNDKDDDDDLA